MMIREINKWNLKTKNEKEHTQIRATHIAFYKKTICILKKKYKEMHLEARDLLGFGKSECFVWMESTWETN